MTFDNEIAIGDGTTPADPNIYSLVVVSNGVDEHGADLLIFNGDLSDVLAGSVITLNHDDHPSRGVPVVSAVYDGDVDQTLVRLAPGARFGIEWQWVSVVTGAVSSLAQEETDAINIPSILSRFTSWIASWF